MVVKPVGSLSFKGSDFNTYACSLQQLDGKKMSLLSSQFLLLLKNGQFFFFFCRSPTLFFFNLILFFNFTILYWFCHISTWIRHRYTRVSHSEPSSLLPPHTIPLGRPSAPAPSIQYRASNLDWQLVSYMILYSLPRCVLCLISSFSFQLVNIRWRLRV